MFRSKGQINGFPALSNLFIRIRPGLHLHDKYKHEKKCQWTNVGREMHLIFLWLYLVPTSKLISTTTGNLTPGSLFSTVSETWRGETLRTRLGSGFSPWGESGLIPRTAAGNRAKSKDSYLRYSWIYDIYRVILPGGKKVPRTVMAASDTSVMFIIVSCKEISTNIEYTNETQLCTLQAQDWLAQLLISVYTLIRL